MSFGRDPSLHPTKEMVLEVLDFLLYLIEVKHKGHYKELKLLVAGEIEYQYRLYSGIGKLLDTICSFY